MEYFATQFHPTTRLMHTFQLILMCIEDCSKIQVDKKFFFIDFSLVEQIMSTAVSLFLAILQEARSGTPHATRPSLNLKSAPPGVEI